MTKIKNLFLIFTVFMFGSFSLMAKTQLTVYTAVEAEDLKRYAATFNEDHPDIEINWVRDSTGIVTAKLLAEKNNPQADIIWGLAGTSAMLMKSECMFEPYAPKGIENLDSKFRDSANPLLGREWMHGLQKCVSILLRQKKMVCQCLPLGKI